MLLKEKGYDEFVSQKIAKAEQSVKAGKTVTLEEARAQSLNKLDELEKMYFSERNIKVVNG